LDNWDIVTELEEIRNLTNPILSGTKEEFLLFDIRKIDPLIDFVNPELKAEILLLKIIRDPREDFVNGW
jgi:hypothetical protein